MTFPPKEKLLAIFLIVERVILVKADRKTCLSLLGALFFINCLIAYEVVHKNHIDFLKEGAFVENVTAFALLFSAILLLFQSFRKKGIELCLNQFFATTCLLLFLRELDVEDLNVPDLLVLLGSGTGRDVLFVGLYLLIIGLIFLKERSQLSAEFVGSCVKSPVTVAVLSGCACFLAGMIFEGKDMVFGEEMMEMNGAFLVMLGALLSLNHPIYQVNKVVDPSL